MRVSIHRDKLPRRNASILYFVLGYGCIAVGESGNGLERVHTTLDPKKWAAQLIWIDLGPLGIIMENDRKYLEALTVFTLSKDQNRIDSRLVVRNTHFKKTLGRFSGLRQTDIEEIVRCLLRTILNVSSAVPDVRGNYIDDIAIFFDSTVDWPSRLEAIRRINNQGNDSTFFGSPKKLTYSELRLETVRGGIYPR